MYRHITDSETWPLDLAAYPEIARASAYSAKARYSEAQVQGIMQYAGEVRLSFAFCHAASSYRPACDTC